MSEFDWRSPEAYASLQSAEAIDFAWECLRRNLDYRRLPLTAAWRVGRGGEREKIPRAMGAFFSQLTPANPSTRRSSSGRPRFCRPCCRREFIRRVMLVGTILT